VRVYLVGGAVRDGLLGLPVTERDWVVTGTTESEMRAAGFERVPAPFPVFLHPRTGEEYALARREKKVGPGYKGFIVEAGPGVTLEEDLARRDLTVNAMAKDEQGMLIDPYGGRADLQEGLLRHVTPAFVEDPVRLLRVARFAARLGRWGFRVSHGTFDLMKRMAASEDLAALQPERVWLEMRRALDEPQPWRFFEVLHFCGALRSLVPELEAALGAAAPHRDTGLPGPLAALRRAVEAGAAGPVRFAVVMLEAVETGVEVPAFCARLRAERDCADLLAAAVAALPRLEALRGADAGAVVEWLERQRAFQQPERLSDLLAACVAARPDLADAARRVEAAFDLAAGVAAERLLAEGFAGAALGAELRRRREAAVAAAEADGETR
jgi:tRNA nucleotidyltransferase (CCA-adding enzyme)